MDRKLRLGTGRNSGAGPTSGVNREEIYGKAECMSIVPWAIVCVRILPCHFLDGGACCLVENWTGHRITFGERHHWCIETPQLSELVIFGSQGHVYIGPAPPTPIRPIRQDDQAVWRELLNPSQETSDEINYEVGSRRSILREKSTNPQGCWSSVIGARILKRKI